MLFFPRGWFCSYWLAGVIYREKVDRLLTCVVVLVMIGSRVVPERVPRLSEKENSPVP